MKLAQDIVNKGTTVLIYDNIGKIYYFNIPTNVKL